MNSTDITSYASRLDDLRVVTLTDGEVWSGRDLMVLTGYTNWRNFSEAIDRAIASVNTSGLDAGIHFVAGVKSSPMPNGGFRQVEDVELTRYGCYILFQNADARKPEIAAAQQYFAVQTRKQELAPAAPAFDPTSIEGITLILVAAQNALAKVKELEPKAQAWDELASAKGDYPVGEAAKMLARAGVPTGPQRLFEQLAAMHWIFRSGHGTWEPYANIVDIGYLASKPMSHEHPKTGERIIDPAQVRVTIKGLERLRQRLHVGALAAVSA
jgi:phage antirepressor YoqD-like protein